MKTQVIPAQITTVEDKIAGNLNLVQILLLLLPVFFATIVYTLFTPRLELTFYKLPLVMAAFLICIILSLRIREKVVLNWFILLLKYNLRPKYYVYNKNESYLRNLDLSVFKKKRRLILQKSTIKQKSKKLSSSFAISDLIRLNDLIASPKYSFSIKTNGKGGLSVAFEQKQK